MLFRSRLVEPQPEARPVGSHLQRNEMRQLPVQAQHQVVRRGNVLVVDLGDGDDVLERKRASVLPEGVDHGATEEVVSAQDERRDRGFTWLKMDVGVGLVSKIPGTLTQPLGLTQREAFMTPHMFTGMELTPKGVGLLADYVGSFHPRLIGLTGSDAEVGAAVRAWKVHRVKYTPANDPKTYGVDHSSLTYLMGPDGKFRTLIPHNTSAERMAEIVRSYLPKG